MRRSTQQGAGSKPKPWPNGNAPSPTGAGRTRLRDDFFGRIAEAVRARPGLPLLVIGDFNVTPYAPSFDILRRAGLTAEAGLGTPVTTWPTWLPMLGLLIDQVLANDRIALDTVETGPDIGADHYAVIAHVRLLE